MEKIELYANKRDILGKKVRFLRRQGITPVNLFGHNVESMALQCDTKQLQECTSQAGRTQLISLKIDKSRKPRMVMIKEVQTQILTGDLLHVDLYQVTMTEKISVDVPITMTGEAPAEKSKDNMLVHELSSLSVEALPNEIPQSIELDISSLGELGQVIRVGDIETGGEVTVLTDPEQVVVRIIARYAAKVEEIAEAEEEEVTAPEETPATEDKPQDE